MFINRKQTRSVNAPSPLALKSPQVYLQIINKVNPAWGDKLKSVAQKNATMWCALAASAVAVGNAARISEVLRIEVCHLMPNGTALLLASKGSNCRTIWAGIPADLVQHFQQLPPHTPLFPVRYQDCWRACVQWGLTVQEQGHEHRSVTHAGRYGFIQKMAGVVGAEVAGNAMGHKSHAAVLNYVDTRTAERERARRKRAAALNSSRVQGPQLPDFLCEGV